MAALHAARGADPDPRKNIAAEAFNQRCALGGDRGCRDGNVDRAGRQLAEDLLDERQALLHFLDANPHPGIHVAGLDDRHFEFQPVVRRIAWRAPRVETAARGASDVAAGSELLREGGRKDAGSDRAVFERRGVFVKLDQLWKLAADEGDKRNQLLSALGREVAAHSKTPRRSKTAR